MNCTQFHWRGKRAKERLGDRMNMVTARYHFARNGGEKMNRNASIDLPGSPSGRLSGTFPSRAGNGSIQVSQEVVADLLGRFGLTVQEERFVVECCCHPSTVRAARLAGYHPKSGPRLAKKEPIRSAIAALRRVLQARLLATPEQVNGALAEIAFADRKPILEALTRSGSHAERLKALHNLPEAAQALIKTIIVDDQKERLQVVLESKQEALRQLSSNLSIEKGTEKREPALLVIDMSEGQAAKPAQAPRREPTLLSLGEGLEIEMPGESSGG